MPVKAPIKMQDIALKANVSQSTVSCVLNGRRKGVWISEDTRTRVLAAANELGYQPNDLARAVVTGKSRMLGFLGFNSRFESAGRMLEAALGEAESQGYTIKVLHSRDNVLDKSMIEACVRSRLSGIITLFPGGHNLDSLREEASRYRIQVALVDNSLPHTWGVRVVSDDRLGVGLAVNHLVELGHKRIVFLSASLDEPMLFEREQGYRDAMARHELPLWSGSVVSCAWNRDAIEAAVDGIVRDPMGPTAIVCAADEIAATAARRLRVIGMHVPRDMSVVGYADILVSELADPPLTTVAQPFTEMGVAAVRHLVSRVENDSDGFSDAPIQESLPTRLIIRESTCPPRTHEGNEPNTASRTALKG